MSRMDAMRSALCLAILISLAACGGGDQSGSLLVGKGDGDDSVSADLKAVLATYAQAACETVENGEQLTGEEAEDVANCFLTEDFQAAKEYAHLAQGRNIAGTGTGLAMACSLARGYRCTTKFLGLGVRADSIEVVGSGTHRLTGVGAASRTVVVRPGSQASIDIEGDSRAYYLEDSDVDCAVGSPYRYQCTPVGTMAIHVVAFYAQEACAVPWPLAMMYSWCYFEKDHTSCSDRRPRWCPGSFWELVSDASSGAAFVGSGDHYLDGYGAASTAAIVKPGATGTIVVRGHSRAYLLGDGRMRCRGNCTVVTF